MASLEKRGRKYIVRWRDPGAGGGQRTRTCPDYETARELKRRVERVGALGERWDEADDGALPTLYDFDTDEDGRTVVVGGMFHAWLTSRARKLSKGTIDAYTFGCQQFLSTLQRMYPRKTRWTIDLLSREALERFDADLVARGQQPPTRRLRIGAVQAAWEWAFDSETYGDDCPRPRSIELPELVSTPPRAPRWHHMDACIAAGFDERHRRLLTILRFTGLRVDQVLALAWDDFDLGAELLTVRGELGKSRQERQGRIVPVSRHLVGLMAGWGRREGPLFAGLARAPFETTAHAWELAEVPEVHWRRHPHHAFRHGFQSELKAAGADDEAVKHLVGHALPGTRSHYIDPKWALPLKAAVDLIPALTLVLSRRAEG